MKTQLSLGELRDKARQILLRDSSKLSGTNYVSYPGKTIAPMSALTQRAQALEQRRAEKGMPYQSALQSLANAPAEGITRENINSILGNIDANHQNFGQNVLLGKLNKQFGPAFESYRPKFENKLMGDTQLKLGELGSDIDTLNAPIKKLEGKRNTAAFNAITSSANTKAARQRGLTEDLYKYGAQKTGIINKGLTAEKAKFEAEKNDPYIRLQNLQQALNGVGTEGMSPDMQGHPDLEKLGAQQLTKALQAYGIDTNKPANEWETSARVNTSGYSGKIVEPLNDQMKRSYQLAEEVSPFYQEQNYLDRKLTRKDLVNSPNAINNFVTSLPEQLRSKFEALDSEAKRKAKADLNALNAKYIRQGTYGSQAHIQAATNRMRELGEATLSSRGNVVKNDLLKGVTSKLYDDINKIGKLGEYDQLANTEMGNTLGQIKQTNLRGLEKWQNDQENNEQLYKAYLNEKGAQQPKLLNNARNSGFNTGIDSGINSMFNYFNNQGIDLSSISDLQGRYSNLERELQTANERIRSGEDFRTRQEELARQNAAEFERERNEKLNLDRERGELNQRLQQEINARLALEQDQQRRQELERQQRILAERAAEAERIRQTEEVRKAEEARLAEVQRQQQQAVEAERARQEQLRQAEMQRLEQQRAAETERIRQQQLQAQLAEQARQQQLQAQAAARREQDEILKAKQQALREFAGMQGGRMGKVEELQSNGLLSNYLSPTDYRYWVLPARQANPNANSFTDALERARWNQMMDARSGWIKR